MDLSGEQGVDVVGREAFSNTCRDSRTGDMIDGNEEQRVCQRKDAIFVGLFPTTGNVSTTKAGRSPARTSPRGR